MILYEEGIASVWGFEDVADKNSPARGKFRNQPRLHRRYAVEPCPVSAASYRILSTAIKREKRKALENEKQKNRWTLHPIN